MCAKVGAGTMIFFRGETAYEWQIGRLYGRWVHLYGGHWEHWWQLSRWSIHWEQR